MSSWPRAFGDCVHECGRRRNRTRLAATFDSEWVGWARRIGHRDIVGWQVVGARHGVVHVAAGDELAVLIVDGVLEQRLADALGDTAMHLAFDDHRIDEDAEVVDGGPTIDPRLAGFRVDLDFGDVHARWEGEVLRVVERPFLESGLDQFADRTCGRRRPAARPRRRSFSCWCRGRGTRRSRSRPISSGTSMQAAATRLPLMTIFSAALTIAEAPTAPEREP